MKKHEFVLYYSLILYHVYLKINPFALLFISISQVCTIEMLFPFFIYLNDNLYHTKNALLRRRFVFGNCLFRRR